MTAVAGDHVGLDFGTSNCLVALISGGRPAPIELEPGETTLPSLVYVRLCVLVVMFLSIETSLHSEFGQYCMSVLTV